LAVPLVLGACETDPGPGRVAPTTIVEGSPSTTPETTSTTIPEEQSTERPTLYLVWTPGGVPDGTEVRLRALDSVAEATTVTGGLAWLQDDGLPHGYAYPLEIAYVGPNYAHLMGAGAGRTRGLDAERIVLADSAHALRKSEQGSLLNLDVGDLEYRGTVLDTVALGYEGLTSGPPPEGWGDDFVLVRSSHRGPIRRTMSKIMEGDDRFRIRAQGETPFLRYADGATPQMYFKLQFGEFAARPSPDGSIEIERAWRKAHIARRTVPILGKVTCHRRFIPALSNAMALVKRKGLGRLVRKDEFAGCYNARFIGRDPSGRLSNHSWGAAVDLNAASNPFGASPSMDTRLVTVMERLGFNWGGDWLVPDGMHFEWEVSPR
jgi:hypothetical protein